MHVNILRDYAIQNLAGLVFFRWILKAWNRLKGSESNIAENIENDDTALGFEAGLASIYPQHESERLLSKGGAEHDRLRMRFRS